MKATKRSTTITAMVSSLAIVLAGCGGGSDEPSTPQGEAERGGSLIYGEGTTFPENLFPLIAAGNSTAGANLLVRIFPSPYITMPDFTVELDADLMAEEPTLEETDAGQIVTYVQ